MPYNIRRLGFWTVDLLRKSPIRNEYKDIVTKMAVEPGNIPAIQNAQFQSIFKHAVETTPFYSAFRKASSLQDLPVINKIKILDNYAQFRSAHFLGNNLRKMVTSGSSGIPFSIFQDQAKRRRVLAELIHFSALAGYNVGERHAFFRVNVPTNDKSKRKVFLQNELMFDVLRQDVEHLEFQRQALLRARPVRVLIGYVSAIHGLANYIIDCGDKPEAFGVRSAICLAEALTPSARTAIEKAFGCMAYSRYSNQENGILAQQISSELFRLNTSSYMFEFLKLDSDHPALPGEEARIVVTDLYNSAMPIFRYDTGDIGILTSDEEGYPALKQLSGRKSDKIIDTSGIKLSPIALFHCFYLAKGIRQFQVIQKDWATYTIKLNCDESVNLDKVIARLVAVLGKNAQITIERVTEIPVLSSGKRRLAVQEYRPTDSQRTVTQSAA